MDTNNSDFFVVQLGMDVFRVNRLTGATCRYDSAVCKWVKVQEPDDTPVGA